jgi:hypothetical protein
MAQKTKSILKTYFESGDIPNSSQYHDLIESQLNLEEEGIQKLSGSLSASSFIASNHITASGNISSSANITSNVVNVKTRVKAITSSLEFSGDTLDFVDASSTSRLFKGTVNGAFEAYYAGVKKLETTSKGVNITGNVTASGGISGSTIEGQNLISDGHITASGNISASNSSTASFGSLVLSNLPTTEPSITGALWLSGSGGGSASGSQYLMVFNP